MTRAGVKRLRRNLAVCAGATGDEDGAVRACTNRTSRRAPIRSWPSTSLGAGATWTCGASDTTERRRSAPDLA